MTEQQVGPRRKPRAGAKKAKAKAVLHAAFHGWEDDEPAALEQRISDVRRLALSRRFTSIEWTTLDAMRDKARANAKFAAAVRETRRASK
jgi:hypothetical protein